MRVINGHRYLELHELQAAGIGVDRVMKARQRGSGGYTFLKDPADRRKLLVGYDDLKPSVKALVDAKHGEAVADSRKVEWEAALAANAADLAVLRGHVLPDGSSLPEAVTHKCARACALLRLVHATSVKQMRAWGYTGAAEWYGELLALIIKEQLPLPSKSARALLSKSRELLRGNALCVVSRRYGNDNARKISEAQSAWLVSMYAQPIKMDTAKIAARYSETAKECGWPALTEGAIYLHLMRPEVRPLWYIGRHGTKAWKSQYEHTMKLRAPSFRDALWCGDGTKLNYYYQNRSGIAAAMQMYVVMDVYSEMILGWRLGEREDFKVQSAAIKGAVKVSGHKPLQLLYDNQSGHKKADQQDFFSRLSQLHFPAQPYNAKSKPIESLLGRLQKEVMRDRWFFTGQNITSKSLDSRPNMEFITAHKQQLPTAEELLAYAQQDVDRWNSMAHPHTGVARMSMYQNSLNPQAQPIGFLDMVELFWHTTALPVKYTNQGITIEVSGERLQYEVYKQGAPDTDFLRNYTNARFFVKYDAEDLGSVLLYRQDDGGELRRVAMADAKRAFARAVVDLQPGERAEIDANLAIRRAQQAAIKQELEEMRNMSGIDPETLVELGPHAPKDAHNAAEARMMMRRLEDDDGYESINAIDAL